FHLLVERQLQTGKDLRDHTATDDLMAMEGPAMVLLEFFRGRLTDVVQNSGPAQPEIVRITADIIQHLQGMIKIILVSHAVDVFGSRQIDHLGKDDLQQPAPVKEIE